MRAVFVTFAILAGLSSATAQQPKWTTRVKVRINDTPESATIISYLNRNLRSLEDVNIVTSEPHFTIQIVSETMRGVSGEHLGYSISSVVTEALEVSLLIDGLQKLNIVPSIVGNIHTMLEDGV